MAKAPEMNVDFARWYAQTFMEEGPIRLARWKGVVETAATADYITVEVLVRYAFATAAPANGGKNVTLNEKHSKILSLLAGSGSPMDPVASQRELQVLCAAVLVQLFSTMPDAAIAVLNAGFEGIRTADLPMDLPSLAKSALVEFSRRKHARPEVEKCENKYPKFTFEVSSDALANMSAPQWKGEFDRLREASRGAFHEIVEGQNRVSKMLFRQIALGEEELQMLWWLVGGHSSTVEMSFIDVPPSLRPFAFGNELGLLTVVSPGPASVIAMLRRAGISNDTLKVSDAVNAADLAWIKIITESTRISPVTTPLHFALEKRGELNSDATWLPVWTAMTGLPADTCMSAVKLAEIFYREHVFLHVND